MFEPSLVGVRAKLDRSEVHAGELDATINAFLSNENYRFVGEEDPEYQWDDPFPWGEPMIGARIVFLEYDELPPDEVWGPIIGDIVQNLRSALDHLAWEVALPNERLRHPRRIEFPILYDDNPDQRRGKLNRLRPEFRAVVDAAQPYKTGDLHHPLWLLDKLWNTDKHRTLHVAQFMFSADPDDPANPFGYTSWSGHPIDHTKHRTEVMREGGTSNTSLQERVNANQALTRDIALGKPTEPPSAAPWTKDYPFSGLPLRPMIRNIRRYIETQILDPLSKQPPDPTN